MYESLPPDYHDTKLWSPDLQPPPSAPMSWYRRRSVQIVAAALVGFLAGLATELPVNDEADRGLSLERQYTAAVAERDEAERELRSAEARATQGEEATRAAETRLATEADQLEAEAQRLATLAEDLAAREAAVATRETAAAAGSDQQTGVEGAAAGAPSSAYYRNCSEARAAGAAPVFAGDPGYGSHLDRDGDGVGCE